MAVSPSLLDSRDVEIPQALSCICNSISGGISLRKQTILLARFLRLPWNGVWFEVSPYIGNHFWSTAVKTSDQSRVFVSDSKGFYSHVIRKSGTPLIRSPYISRTLFNSDSTRIVKKSRKGNAKDQQSRGVAIRAPAVVTFRATRSLSGYQVICFRSVFLSRWEYWCTKHTNTLIFLA